MGCGVAICVHLRFVVGQPVFHGHSIPLAACGWISSSPRSIEPRVSASAGDHRKKHRQPMEALETAALRVLQWRRLFGCFSLVEISLTMTTDPDIQPTLTAAEHWLASAAIASDFAVPSTLSDWQARRSQVRDRLRQLLGNLPPRPKLPQVETLSREERDGYGLEKIQLETARALPCQAIYCCPPALPQGRRKLSIVTGTAGNTTSAKTNCSARTPRRFPPPSFGEPGYVVCAIDAYGFGERSGQGPGGPQETGGAGELTASKFNLWVGRTLWGMIARDDLMALDYLCSRPEVDSNRIGVTGISMGATRTWWLMALDERPRPEWRWVVSRATRI